MKNLFKKLILGGIIIAGAFLFTVSSAQTVFVVGQTREAASTSNGTQEFTITWSDGGTYTPQAVEVRVTKATTNDSAEDHATISVGATDGTVQWSQSIASESGVTTTSVELGLYNDRVITIPDDDGEAVEAYAVYDSFGSNTVTLDWTDAPPSAYLVQIIAYAGADAIEVGTGTASGTDGASVDETGLGDYAHYVFFGGAKDNTTFGEQQNGRAFGLGFYSYDESTARQVTVTWAGRNGQSAADVHYQWSDEVVGVTHSGGVDGLRGTYTIDPHANGFSVRLEEVSGQNAGSNPYGYLAMHLPDGQEAYAGALATKTTTGSQAYTSPGWRPQALTLMGGFADNAATTEAAVSNNPETTSPDTDAFFLGGAISPSSQYSISLTDYHGQSTTNTQNLWDDVIARVITDTGTTKIDANLESFDSTGFTLDFDTTDGTARNWVYVAFQQKNIRRVIIVN